MKKLRLILLIALAVFAVVWIGDYLLLRLHREQYGSVVVQRFYEITLKNRKTEYMSEEPKPQQCVNSLFPHFGYSTCWWLEGHRRQIVRVDPGHRSDFWKIP